MKTLKATLLALVVLLGAAVSASAFAHGGRFSGRHFHHRSHVAIGIGFGAPFYYSPWYYPPAYYSYPPAVVYSSPPVYVEQGDAAAPESQGYWYYCRESKTYYPYVKECAGPWQRVVPQPPPS